MIVPLCTMAILAVEVSLTLPSAWQSTARAPGSSDLAMVSART